jgi:hypothetical protein
MLTGVEMAVEDLDALLERMTKIAEAVNGFTSEAVQQEAFAALVSAFTGRHRAAHKEALRGDDPPTVDAPQLEEAAPSENQSSGRSARAGDGGSKPRRREGVGAREGIKVVRDLNLRPTGRQSFDEFISEKKPVSNEDKYAVIIYYLENVLDMTDITVDHVGTVFRMTKQWREPASIAAALRGTAARKATIDSDPKNLRMTAHGRNFVEHDLPVAEKVKK